MIKIPAETYDIEIHDGVWQISPAQSAEPVFWVAHGSGVLEYSADFGSAHKLPGTRLSVEYVHSVVIGFDASTQCWRLGFHLARTSEEKPRWLELLRWPAGSNLTHAAPAQQAARELAENLGCALKVFGAEMLPKPVSNPVRSGITGPLVPHQREDISPQRVKLFAQSVKLPIQHSTMWLGASRDGITLKFSKDTSSTQQNRIAPAYNQVIIDTKNGVIRLVPPTGLLSAFFGGPQGREIKGAEVHNVELRYRITHEHMTRPDNQATRLAQEITYTYYTWDVFLTLSRESLLIAQTHHSTDSDLSRKRAMAGNKFAVDTQAGIDYLRQHQEDQQAYEAAETAAWTVAVVIASHLDTHLVKTEVTEI